MADKPGVWGIDIGQAGLKAIRLQYVESSDQVVATAFDYVPHPKILSQPDAIPEELIPQALETFLSRNDLKGDQVGIAVPGQSALARFIQLPPVESSKVSEIVKYEARQQIPFALEEVIWDYQTLGKGTEESGFLLEAEVGLFAMKRDQVMQHLKPFTEAGVEVDLIQIAPLALYNYLSYDQFGIRLGDETVGLDEYTIVLDMGADNTTLLVSNGQKIWIRNVPIGGNHFTRALTKEMKLTFAKAEHLKCNATRSPDPRSVFQALRPVFNDYVSEIQRSIGYFSSVNRDAKIARVLGMGNGFKLAGLQKFLQQNLQYEVDRVETFGAVVGDAVLTAPLFEENILSFTVPYGIALQGLKQTRIRTSLLPREIATARTILRKKPWAVAAAASLLVGLSLSASGYATVARSVGTERWGESESKATKLKGDTAQYNGEYSAKKGDNKTEEDRAAQLVGSLQTREQWMAAYKAINECLPRDIGNQQDQENVALQNRLKIKMVSVAYNNNLTDWFKAIPPHAQVYLPKEYKDNPPKGTGYVFTILGYSYHNDPSKPETHTKELYVLNTLVENLKKWTIDQSGGEQVGVGKIGFSHPVLINFQPVEELYNPNRPPDLVTGNQGSTLFFGQNNAAAGGLNIGRRGGGGGGDDDDDKDKRGNRGRQEELDRELLKDEKTQKLTKTFFQVEVVWKPIPENQQKKDDPKAASAAAPAATPPATPGNETK